MTDITAASGKTPRGRCEGRTTMQSMTEHYSRQAVIFAALAREGSS